MSSVEFASSQKSRHSHAAHKEDNGSSNNNNNNEPLDLLRGDNLDPTATIDLSLQLETLFQAALSLKDQVRYITLWIIRFWLSVLDDDGGDGGGGWFCIGGGDDVALRRWSWYGHRPDGVYGSFGYGFCMPKVVRDHRWRSRLAIVGRDGWRVCICRTCLHQVNVFSTNLSLWGLA